MHNDKQTIPFVHSCVQCWASRRRRAALWRLRTAAMTWRCDAYTNVTLQVHSIWNFLCVDASEDLLMQLHWTPIATLSHTQF